MSWQDINEILGLATIDPAFCQKLLRSPLEAIDEKGFQLTHVEREIISTIRADDLPTFSQIVLLKLAH